MNVGSVDNVDKKQKIFFTKMNTEYRYILEKGSKKHVCPECNKKKFVRYKDTLKGDYLPYQYGRCDDEHYFLNPYLDGYAKAIKEQEQGNRSGIYFKRKPQPQKAKPQQKPEPVFFDFEAFKQTLKPEQYEKNTFIQNLFYRVQFPFEVNEVTKVIQLYRLGTISNGYRTGANTFPFIDINGNIRAVQVKQFDEGNHTTGTDFLHSIIEKHHTRNNLPLPEWLEAYTNQDKRISCLFGEHLLNKYQNNPVALVEAPKTAVYGSLYFGLPENPENFIWLAVYNKSSFSFDKIKSLQGRFVYVFPDLSKEGNTFKEWETKAKDYERLLPGTRFIFSDLLERLAPERDKSEGNDIADYLIKQDWRNFRKLNLQEQPPQPEPVQIGIDVQLEAPTEILNVQQLPEIEAYTPEPIEQVITEQLIDWNNEISELETFFSGIDLPNKPLNLNPFSTINNCSLFIESHFETIKYNNGKRKFVPYLNRLQELKQVLTTNLN